MTGYLSSRRFLTSLTFVMIVVVLAPSVAFADPIGQWSEPIALGLPPESPDASDKFGVELCDEYQNLHVLWGHTDSAGSVLYHQSRSNDQLSDPVDVLVAPQGEMLRLSAGISTQTETVHLIWQSRSIAGDVYYSNVSLARAAQSGAWAKPSLLTTAVDGAAILVDEEGILHYVYGISDADGKSNAVYYSRSSDDGLTWSEPTTAYSVFSAEPSTISGGIAVDVQGRIHIGVTIRTQEYGIYSEVGYVRSEDGGLTWSAYRLVEANGSTFQGVSTLIPYAFGNDEIYLTWHDPKRMYMMSPDGGRTWNDPIEITPLAAAFGGPNQLVKDSAGVMYVILAEGGGVHSAEWNGVRWGRVSTIDNRSFDPHGQNIVACQGNILNVVYYDRTGDQRVWYSSMATSGPHMESRPIPQSTEATGGSVSEGSATAPRAETDGGDSPSDSTDSPAVQISTLAPKNVPSSATAGVVVGVVPVLVLIVLVIAVVARSRRRLR